MKKFFIGSLLLLSPSIVFAQSFDTTDASTLITSLLNFLQQFVIPLIFVVAVVFFFYGLMKFMLNAGDETARETGKQIMIWGAVTLFVMLSIFAIVEFLQNTFGVDAGDTNVTTDITIPTITTTGS